MLAWEDNDAVKCRHWYSRLFSWHQCVLHLPWADHWHELCRTSNYITAWVLILKLKFGASKSNQNFTPLVTDSICPSMPGSAVMGTDVGFHLLSHYLRNKFCFSLFKEEWKAVLIASGNVRVRQEVCRNSMHNWRVLLSQKKWLPEDE